jgi:membrane protease YdiL (CAAX protease family)
MKLICGESKPRQSLLSEMAIRNFRARGKQLLHDSKASAVVELLIALLIIVGGLAGLVPFSPTPFLLLFACLALWLRGVGWREIGLARPASWRLTLLLGLGGGVAYQCLSLYAIEPLLARLTGSLPDARMFAFLVGNTRFFLLSLAVTWTLAAFGEELVSRGYLMNRVADLAGRGRAAWAISLVAVSVLFGVMHLYQGASGVISNTLTGLVFGALYLASGRNLWALLLPTE